MADSLIPALKTREAVAAGALAFIIAVTAAWWALALWPVPGEVPGWLASTRAWCFGSLPNGLPSPVGWMLLIGEPIAMVIALMIIAGDAVPAAILALAAHRSGRVALIAVVALKVGALSAAAVRVTHALRDQRVAAEPPGAALLSFERLDRMAPPLALVDQHGNQASLGQFRGRLVIVAFAYAHCETVCPLVVREVLRAGALLGPSAPRIVFVTLDPWRDTPSRLPTIAETWKLGTDALVLSGAVPEVERVLDAWEVARTRDPNTGEVSHATPVFVIAPDGRLGYRVGPYADAIAQAARALAS